jgi:penicillin-binding protein 2
MAERRPGIDRLTLRLSIFGVLMVAAFVALFSRLWFLQVLESDNYHLLAQENRVRFVHSEPPRGRILDRNGEVLVENRQTFAVTIDRQVFDPLPRRQKKRLIRNVSELTEVDTRLIRENLRDTTVSPYKPVAVVTDVSEGAATRIQENYEDFPGVGIDQLPLRRFPQGNLAAHMLGYVGEISPENLKSAHFKDARPRYFPGDLVGRDGLEYTYDRFLRGKPRIEKVIVNSSGDVIANRRQQKEHSGDDLVLSVDAGIQKVTERALKAGIDAARGAGYAAPGGAVVVMDPSNGDVVGMASLPNYDPRILADGITKKEFASLGAKTPQNPNDDALFNRAIQGQRPPGSTFKIVTAGAALWSGVVGLYDQIECPGSRVFPPEGGPGSVVYNNWTSRYFGYVGFPTSLEISCDTFYYELGWRMETAFGPPESRGGDGTEKFQRYMRRTGFGKDTGVDLPNEAEGRVPDNQWCKDNEDIGYCPDGWLPGYTVNMSIGQGDLIVTPMQLAVAFSAIANGGTVWQPQLADSLQNLDELEQPQVVKEFEDRAAQKLPLDATQLGVIQEGLELVISGGEGTASGAFSGFPLDEFPLAGKTGTAEVDGGARNDAWFVAYGPTDSPQYLVAVAVEDAGHGGESAAPIARQIFDGIFGIDKETTVRLGEDFSG